MNKITVHNTKTAHTIEGLTDRITNPAYMAPIPFRTRGTERDMK